MFIEVKKVQSQVCDLLELYNSKNIQSFVLSSPVIGYKKSIIGGVHLAIRKNEHQTKVLVATRRFNIRTETIANFEVIGIFIKDLNSEPIVLIEVKGPVLFQRDGEPDIIIGDVDMDDFIDYSRENVFRELEIRLPKE